MSDSFWLRVGSLLGGLAVAAGAFGAHLLEKQLDTRSLQVFETAARYQMFHALAIGLVGVLGMVGGSTRPLRVAGWAFLVGTVLFSGSLYALALTGITKLGAITPIGGVGFLVGWTALAFHRVGSKPVAQADRGVK